jgi:hypothetical protein
MIPPTEVGQGVHAIVVEVVVPQAENEPLHDHS